MENTELELMDEDRKRIRAEEIYREEIRADLNVKSRRERLWEIVNSNFVIFLLSTIAIGLFTFLYQTYEKSQSRYDEARRLSHKISVELSARGFVFEETFYPLSKSLKTLLLNTKDEPVPKLAESLAEIVYELDHSSSPMYVEFHKRGFLTLIREQRELLEAHGQLSPGSSPSRKNFLVAENQFRELKGLVEKASQNRPKTFGSIGRYEPYRGVDNERAARASGFWSSRTNLARREMIAFLR